MVFGIYTLIVGIDLAGVEKRPTGFCILDCKTMKAKTCLLYDDKEILKKIEKTKPSVIAIDAPLTLPKGRKSLEKRSNIHLRKCDKDLLKLGIKFFPITLGPMRELTKRGIRLKKALEKKGYEVIEVYPGGAQDALGIPRKQKGLKKLKEGLEKIGIKGLDEKMSDHELDAVTCALVGKFYVEGKYVALGDEEEGQIIMPKLKNNELYF
jgi:hypothetical protein